MTDKAISPLRQRMIEDMTIRKLSPKTQHDYVQRVKNFAAFLGRSPDTASFEDVRRYQLHLAASGVGVPARWIRAIIQIESAGDEHAISARGAMGLMQLMPATWVELSVRYRLGLDPFDPRDNVMAGTAYLRELRDRFGSAGFLAAYHAGPTRYEQHLTKGEPVPPETAAYIAAVTPLLADEPGKDAAVRTKRAVPWREAPLFVERAEAR